MADSTEIKKVISYSFRQMLSMDCFMAAGANTLLDPGWLNGYHLL